MNWNKWIGINLGSYNISSNTGRKIQYTFHSYLILIFGLATGIFAGAFFKIWHVGLFFFGISFLNWSILTIRQIVNFNDLIEIIKYELQQKQ